MPAKERHHGAAERDADASPLAKPAARTNSNSGVIRQIHGHVTEVDFFDWQPHTVLGGIALLSILFFVHRWYVSTDVNTNIKIGLGASLWSFCVFGMLHFPDGVMVRPHPIVWRFVMALIIVYMMTIIFFLFQDYKTTRMIIGWYDPSSIPDLEDRSWAEDCSMSTAENPYLWLETIFDEFLLAHVLGYLGKMVVLRDWKLVMFISFGFEIVEFSLQHLLPNFKECWWDHVIADVIVCNAGGAVLGWWVLRLIGAKDYEFVELTKVPGVAGKAKRVLAQLVPRSLDRFDWEMFKSFKRFAQIFGLVFVLLLGELNAFTTKLLWNLKPSHHLVLGRLAIYSLAGIPGIREYYDFVAGESKHASRVGPMAWLVIFTLTLETLWTVKMIRESHHRYFTAAHPAHIVVPWAIIVALFAVWLVAFFATKEFRARKTLAARLWRGFVTVMLYGVLGVIAWMCLMATPHVEWFRKDFDEWAAQAGWWPYRRT